MSISKIIEYCYDFRIKCQDKLNISIEPLKIIKLVDIQDINFFSCSACFNPYWKISTRCDDSYGRCIIWYYPFLYFSPFLAFGYLKIYLSFRYISASLLPLLCRPNLYSRSLSLLFFHCSFFYYASNAASGMPMSYGDFVNYCSAQRQSYDRECVIDTGRYVLQKCCKSKKITRRYVTVRINKL